MNKAKITYLSSAPRKTSSLAAIGIDVQKSLLIFDQRLASMPVHRKFISQFPYRQGFSSGEKLKNLDAFAKNFSKISMRAPQVAKSQLHILALGGGSIGDFAGFTASVYQRGVRFTQVPTTWLAAIDSAHGGKNALNAGNAKNQVGTFHFPQDVLLFKYFLPATADRCAEAFGELFKAIMLKKSLRRKFLTTTRIDHQFLWKQLPGAIKTKNEIVQIDPFESKKIRYALNLGHSLGHAMEINSEIPHGIAVLFGVEFAIKWSVEKGFLDHDFLSGLQRSPLLQAWYDLKNQTVLRRVQLSSLLKNEKKLIALISKDKKKKNAAEIDEVFLDKKGFRVAKVSFAEFSAEIQRQKSSLENIF